MSHSENELITYKAMCDIAIIYNLSVSVTVLPIMMTALCVTGDEMVTEPCMGDLSVLILHFGREIVSSPDPLGAVVWVRGRKSLAVN